MFMLLLLLLLLPAVWFLFVLNKSVLCVQRITVWTCLRPLLAPTIER